MIRLSSGRAMNETDFCSARFELLPSFFRTLDFLGMMRPGISSEVLSFSSRTASSPLATEVCTSIGATDEESAILIQNTTKNHTSFLSICPRIYFDLGKLRGSSERNQPAVDWARAPWNNVQITELLTGRKNTAALQTYLSSSFCSRMITSRRSPIKS